MKKFCYSALMVLVIIIGIGVLFFNKNEETRVPELGVYFFPQNSFYAAIPLEEMYITLDFFEVVKADDTDKYIFDGCSEFRLVSEEGREYPVNIYKDNVCDDNKDVMIRNHLRVKKLRSDVLITPNETVRIVGFKFKDKKDATVYRDVGCIEIYVLTNLKNGLQVSSNRIDWESFIQPTFDHVELIVSNNEQQNVEITDLFYGHTGIEVKDGTTFKIKAQEEKDISIDVALNKEKVGEPIVYYLKPVIKYTCNNESKESVCNNVCREMYYGTSEEIREYLYRISKEGGK